MGTYLRVGSDIDLELAFRAGVEQFLEHDFKIGDPQDYLHPPGHPHNRSPNLQTCSGCVPPVHGEMLLLRNEGGEVQRYVHSSNGHGEWNPLPK